MRPLVIGIECPWHRRYNVQCEICPMEMQNCYEIPTIALEKQDKCSVLGKLLIRQQLYEAVEREETK